MSATSPLDPAERARHLRAFLLALVAVAGLFGALELAASVAFRDAGSAAAGGVMWAFAGVVLVALRLNAIGRSGAAAMLASVGVVLTGVGVVLVQSVLYSALVIVGLIAIAIVLPVLRGRALAVALVVAWVAAIAIASLGLLRPVPSALPTRYLAAYQVAAVGAAVGLVLILLTQYGTRLTKALESTEQAMRELRASEAERRQTERRLQERERQESLGVLAGGVAHDFNNLLTTIIGYTQLLRTETPEGHPDEVALAAIDGAAQRAAGLSRQMLAYSGRGAFALRPLSVAELFADMALDAPAALPDRTAVRWSIDPDLPTIRGDAAQLRQALLDLVTNAGEALATDGRGGTVTVSARVVALAGPLPDDTIAPDPVAPGRYVALSVHDSGPGMDAGVRDRAFEPFVSTRFVGRGMGLPVVLGIARGHRGAVIVTTDAERGTTVTILLPVPSVAPAPAPDPTGV